MDISIFDTSQSAGVIDLFIRVFSDSEGRGEGQSIGCLVAELISTTDDDDIIGFIAKDGDALIGGIFFSRLFLATKKSAFMLSPVAIASEQQGKGIGQALIRYGINQLKSKGVELLVTYGDPNYYAKVGFEKVGENTICPPYNLSQPEGWLAQSLSGNRIEAIEEPIRCVKAFHKPAYW